MKNKDKIEGALSLGMVTIVDCNGEVLKEHVDLSVPWIIPDNPDNPDINWKLSVPVKHNEDGTK